VSISVLVSDPNIDGGRDGRDAVVLRRLIEHPTSILTDSKPPVLPLAVQIVRADGSGTLVTVLPRVEEGKEASPPDQRSVSIAMACLPGPFLVLRVGPAEELCAASSLR
jgi:hypothetical protein